MRTKQPTPETNGYGYTKFKETDIFLNEEEKIFETDDAALAISAFNFICTVNSKLHDYSTGLTSRMGLNKIACFSY